MQIFTGDPALPICPWLVRMLPHACEDCPPGYATCSRALATARTSTDHHIGQWPPLPAPSNSPRSPHPRNEPT